MLRNIDPPLGFGKKCPERLAYKKLIRMNMPMDFEGKVRKLFLFAQYLCYTKLDIPYTFLAANIFIELVNLNKLSKFYLLSKTNLYFFVLFSDYITLPMLQCRPNCMELRLVDSYIQILCRFQKYKRKIPPPSLLSTKK